MIKADDRFDRFQEKVFRLQDKDQVDWNNLSENELKSKAVLRDLDGLYQEKISLEDLISVLPDITGNDKTFERCFWSDVAGNADLNDTEIEILTEKIDQCCEYSHEKIDLISILALKDDRIWYHYNQELRAISGVSLLYSLSKISKIDEKWLPLMYEVFGKNFTEAYIENKELIDRTPNKYNFIGITDHCLQANFLDTFTHQLKKLTANFGENPEDYRCISNALEKEGFYDAACKLMNNMLAHKEEYICVKENYNSSEFIRETFPELIELMEKNFPPKISPEKIEEISRNCFNEQKIRKMIRYDEELQKKDTRLLNDILAQNPDNIDQVKKAVELFYNLNERPERYGSDYNRYYPNCLVPLVKKDLPDWMYQPVCDALRQGVISKDRLGSIENLFDAAKAWKINPGIWKREAETIGKMSLEARIVAGSIFSRIIENQQISNKRSEQRELFWQEMNKAQEMGWKKAISYYCSDNAETRGRILSVYHPELSEDMQKLLRSCIHIRNLVDIDWDKINHNADLFEEYLGISKNELFSGVEANKKLLKRLFIFDKIFPDEEFKLKYLNSAKQNNVSPNDAIEWLPCHFSDEKIASFANFLKKNLFYSDESGNDVCHSYDQIQCIASIWESLTPQQEEHDFNKLLGTYYTYMTVEDFESRMNQYRFERSKNNVIIPDNLRLYQKYLLIKFYPETQEEIDDLLALNRSQGMEKLVEYLSDDSYHTNNSNNNVRPRRRRRNMDSKDRRYFVDLVIGNDAQINDFERYRIAELSPQCILTFKSKKYKEIVNMIMEAVAKDPKADEIFRKYYAEMVAEQTNITNQSIINVRNHYRDNKDWIVPSAIRMMICFGNDYNRYLDKITKYNLYIENQINKGNENVSEGDIINIHDALYWLPNDIKLKDRSSFMEFIDKYFIYKDNTGIIRHRNFAEFEVVAKGWSYLTDEERKIIKNCYL